MNPARLRELADKYRNNREYITNEEMTKQALVVPFLAGLGYDPTNPREVRLEYAAEFTQNDGKRLPDRMDYAIFDATGKNVLLVIEAKPLGFDVRSRSPQLSRYMSQIPTLRFGIITDGCEYLLFSDLNQPNVMDMYPFFSFSLANPKIDFESVARFLGKFSRDQFNADRLVREAEDAVYRQQMVDRLVEMIKNPEAHDGFMRWLTDGLVDGKRTANVMERLGRIAKEAIQPAILQTLSDDFVDSLRQRIHDASAEKAPEPITVQPPVAGPPAADPARRRVSAPTAASTPSAAPMPAPAPRPLPPPIEEAEPAQGDATQATKRAVVTTEVELDFHREVLKICVAAGLPEAGVLYRDTTNYFNVSWQSPTKWFIRLFSDSKRMAITTWVEVDEAKALAPGFDVEPSPPVFGTSRIYLSQAGDISQLGALVLRSLEICRAPKEA